MKVFTINYKETVYYMQTEIKAETEEEAREKFLDELAEGNIRVSETDDGELDVVDIEEEITADDMPY